MKSAPPPPRNNGVLGLRPPITDPVTSARMRDVKRAGTGPEARVAEALRFRGIRYRFNVRSLPGTPDLANKRSKFAIFVQGCFWHRHTGCKRATLPKRNTDFWLGK